MWLNLTSLSATFPVRWGQPVHFDPVNSQVPLKHSLLFKLCLFILKRWIWPYLSKHDQCRLVIQDIISVCLLHGTEQVVCGVCEPEPKLLSWQQKLKVTVNLLKHWHWIFLYLHVSHSVEKKSLKTMSSEIWFNTNIITPLIGHLAKNLFNIYVIKQNSKHSAS